MSGYEWDGLEQPVSLEQAREAYRIKLQRRLARLKWLLDVAMKGMQQTPPVSKHWQPRMDRCEMLLAATKKAQQEYSELCESSINGGGSSCPK